MFHIIAQQFLGNNAKKKTHKQNNPHGDDATLGKRAGTTRDNNILNEKSRTRRTPRVRGMRARAIDLYCSFSFKSSHECVRIHCYRHTLAPAKKKQFQSMVTSRFQYLYTA